MGGQGAFVGEAAALRLGEKVDANRYVAWIVPGGYRYRVDAKWSRDAAWFLQKDWTDLPVR